MSNEEKVKAAAERIVGLGEELEAPGHATTEEASLAQARAVLHQWVEGLKGVVVNPALGRVTVIHEGGYASSIASADLAFQMSAAGITRAT